MITGLFYYKCLTKNVPLLHYRSSFCSQMVCQRHLADLSKVIGGNYHSFINGGTIHYIYNSYLFWSNYKCRALVTRKQKKKLKLNIKLNNAYFKLQFCELIHIQSVFGSISI